MPIEGFILIGQPRKYISLQLKYTMIQLSEEPLGWMEITAHIYSSFFIKAIHRLKNSPFNHAFFFKILV